MKKKFILVTLLLISFIMTSSYTTFAESHDLSVMPMVKNLKGRDELIKYLDKIQVLRSNISTINITSNTSREEANDMAKQINFYLSEISSIEKSIGDFRENFKGSQADLFFSEHILILLKSYKMSLDQQLLLLDSLVKNQFDATKLFYSNYLEAIYFYLDLGDQMASYISRFYNL